MFGNVQASGAGLDTLSGLVDLIAAVVADPKAVAKTVKDMKAQVDAMSKMMDEQRALNVANEKARVEAAAALEKLAKDTAEFEQKRADADARGAQALASISQARTELEVMRAEAERMLKDARADAEAAAAARQEAEALRADAHHALKAAAEHDAELQAKLANLRAAVGA